MTTTITISPVTPDLKPAWFTKAIRRQWVVVVAGKTSEVLWFHDRADADEAVAAVKRFTEGDVVVREKTA